ncbi:MAG: methyltransferase domain-containing protein [Deltaproteobacteria bacterium]|nr:methyltransferase domain-containing protein [Deltaproteobacteria bacterium]
MRRLMPVEPKAGDLEGEGAAEHYDRVTESWQRYVMGDELHFGLFLSPTESLTQAARNLTERLIVEAQLSPGLRVLDLGCGLGTQAVHLAETHRCHVTGVSTSEVGLSHARALAERSHAREQLVFAMADGADTQLASGSFDRVWALESVHLMPNKSAVFSECFRVLRPGGKLALCDVSLVGRLTSGQAEVEGYRMLGHSEAVALRMRDAVHRAMHRAFGSSELSHFETYSRAAETAGFSEIAIEDISNQTRATLEQWGRNAVAHWDALEGAMGRAYLDDLFLALLHMSFGWGRLGGYVVMTARKK